MPDNVMRLSEDAYCCCSVKSDFFCVNLFHYLSSTILPLSQWVTNLELNPRDLKPSFTHTIMENNGSYRARAFGVPVKFWSIEDIDAPVLS